MNYKRLFIENGYIFVTVVTHNRNKILIENINTLKNSLKFVKTFYSFEILAICILPDHLHMIIHPEKTEEYPKIIKSIKYSFTKNLKLNNPLLTKVWQNRFYEHTIRNPEDLNNHIDYLHYNPVKHNLVLSVKEWEYSSFKKFVKNGLYERSWGDYSDIKKIAQWDVE